MYIAALDFIYCVMFWFIAVVEEAVYPKLEESVNETSSRDPSECVKVELGKSDI